MERNINFSRLSAGYLFPEVARRTRQYKAEHPNACIISLGIGNTTEPLTPHISRAMADYSLSLGTAAGYSGYGDDQGLTELRKKIAATFYNGLKCPVDASEVFISDGAKCDIARVQTLFGSHAKAAVQDPAYPVYVDGSVLAGAVNIPCGSNGSYTATSKDLEGNAIDERGITYLPCTPSNGFFPDLTAIADGCVIYFCSPNNPTGRASTAKELQMLVDYANLHRCIIVYDAAYAQFIRDKGLPKSIFEVAGARTCAIEINSLSKPAGFTGVRLGWSVVPNDLVFDDGTPVIQDWSRVMTTLFNGASNIAQHGALAALDEEGLAEMKSTIDYYLENAKLIKEVLCSPVLQSAGVDVYGTGNSPYLWAYFPGFKSWEIFDKILDECHVVTTPGSGFGATGEGFLRFSAFGHRASIESACTALSSLRL